ALTGAVAGRAVRTLRDQADVVDLFAPVAVDQHVLAGRILLVGGEGLHAVGVLLVLAPGVADRVVQDLQVRAPEPDAVAVAALRAEGGAVARGDVGAVQGAPRRSRLLGDPPVDHHVARLDGDASGDRLAATEDDDRLVFRARPPQLQPAVAHVAGQADPLARAGGAHRLLHLDRVDRRRATPRRLHPLSHPPPPPPPPPPP